MKEVRCQSANWSVRGVSGAVMLDLKKVISALGMLGIPATMWLVLIATQSECGHKKFVKNSLDEHSKSPHSPAFLTNHMKIQ